MVTLTIVSFASVVVFGSLTYKYYRFRKHFIPILLYHYYDGTGSSAGSNLSVPIKMFQKQLEYLMKRGYSVTSLSAVLFGAERPVRPVVITVDDGDTSFFRSALPILQRYRLPVTVFLCVDFLDQKGSPCPTPLPMASWSCVGDALRANPSIEVGCHSWSHRDLTQEKADLTREVSNARTVLERRLNAAIRFFSYPFGRYDSQVVKHVRAAGYAAACATTWGDPRRRDLFRLEREPIYATTTLWQFHLKVNGVYSFLRNLLPLRWWRARRWPK